MTASGLLLIISGPSGVGKTTITRRVHQQLGGMLSVSVTTRPPTRTDTEGVDYQFIDEDKFNQMRDGDELLEYAEVFGHAYGTPRKPVLDAISQGKLMILEIDVEGAIQIKSNTNGAFAIFVLPPDEQVLLKRLHNRAREDENAIQGRFKKAKAEMARARSCGIYDAFIVNKDLDQAVDQAIHLVQSRCKTTCTKQ